MESFVRVLRDVVLLVSRCVLGAVALWHGWQHWRIDGLDAQVAAMTAQGVPQPQVVAWGFTMLELVGGALLVFGVLTPVLGLLFAVQAALTLFWLDPGTVGGVELVAVMGALALVLAVFGAGRAAIDQLFRRPEEPEDDELRYDETRPA
ncbi:DoxX family protein [Auraticoccus monumenti]|uniref:Putative oxidoreductase n=1 Tax=Auraticoccus monumenti TaxID=675864 RepID=A0A1G6VW75_9ACTN|nr:DoxX family protein [Auraticoccus monumenti]SDD57683.1 putative oxidoreductase [Auraticoccus monumenti]